MATIYVGNLNYRATEEDLKGLFSEYGSVESVKIIKDKMTGRARGYCFVEMPDDNAAENAIGVLNGKEFMTRNLIVNKAKPMEPRS